MVPPAQLLRNRGTLGRPRYSAPAILLIRQPHTAVSHHLDARRGHHFPGVIIRIGKIARISAVVGPVRGLQLPAAIA